MLPFLEFHSAPRSNSWCLVTKEHAMGPSERRQLLYTHCVYIDWKNYKNVVR